MDCKYIISVSIKTFTSVRFNAIWLYGIVILVWILLQILFNEQVIPRHHYYLFLGAGMHAITVAHVPEYVKLIDTDPDMKKNVLWSTKLSNRQLRINLRLQNLFWFLFNVTIISCVWITSKYIDKNAPFYVLWPFTPGNTFHFHDNKVFKVIHYVAPVIIILGTISQIIIWFFEERPIKIKTLSRGIKLSEASYSVSDNVDWEGEEHRTYEGWQYVDTVTYADNSKWHKHTYDRNLNSGVQGKFNQVIYPLLNIWENFGDRNIQT